MSIDEIESILEWTELLNGSTGATTGSGAPAVTLTLARYWESVDIGGHTIWDSDNSEASTNEERIRELNTAVLEYLGSVKHMADAIKSSNL